MLHILMATSPFQIIAAPFTPMSSSGALDLSRVAAYYGFLEARGVDGVFVCGTTGEGALMTGTERRSVLEAWVDARTGNAAFRIFAHVGSECPALSVELAEHAAGSGADAIAMMSPTFFKPQNEEAVVDQAAVVASAASQLPFYYYHIPSMTGLALSIPCLIKLASEAIPSFAGVKFTHSDLGEYADCLHVAGDNLEILFGRDELLLAGLAMGARGAVGSTYNFASPLYRQVIAAFEVGDMETARIHQMQARKMIEVVVRHGLPGQKAAMGLAGFECGPSRLPLRNLGTPEKEWLAANLRKEWIA
jgi:N-acetylneuraminate lyase